MRSSTALTNKSSEAEHLGINDKNKESPVSMSDHERKKRSWIELSRAEKPTSLNEASKYTVQNHTGLDIDMHFFKEIPPQGVTASQQVLTEKQTIRFKKHLNDRKLPTSPFEHVDAMFFEQPQSTSSTNIASA